MSDPYVLVSVGDDGALTLKVSGGNDFTWSADKVEGIFRIISSGYACHIDAFLQGSGSRRASLRDALANSRHVFFVSVDGRTCICLNLEKEHEPGRIAWLNGS